MTTSIKPLKLSGNLRIIHDARFYNKDGSLTSYAFACGYFQEAQITASSYIQLLQDGCYHVKGKILGTSFWFCFDKLGEARLYYRAKLQVMKMELKEQAL